MQQDDQVDTGQRAIQQARKRAGGQHLANLGIAIDPHHQITFRTLLKEGIRQRDQVL